MKLLYHGPLWYGSTSLQRADAFARHPDMEIVKLDTNNGVNRQTASLYERTCSKVGWPRDALNENERLLIAARQARPDIILVDNSKVIHQSTLRTIRQEIGAVLVYYSPDDMMAPHNFKRPVQKALHIWDAVLVTKAYNITELKAAGARNPILIGKSFDPEIHYPLTRTKVGPDYEAFDAVFIGAFEAERARSLNRLAGAGLNILVHGSRAGVLAGDWSSTSRITLRPPVFGKEYTRALHYGKVALCFLRKINRDQITQRSIELPAIARPMVAEKTAEHDSHFDDGSEYAGFGNDGELVATVKNLLIDTEKRNAIAAAGHKRCVSSGYSVDDRAAEMITLFRELIEERNTNSREQTSAQLRQTC